MKYLLLTLLLFPSVAMADGPYFTASGGTALLRDHEFHEETQTHKPGLYVSGELGWDFGPIRFGTEVLHLRNTNDKPFLPKNKSLEGTKTRTHLMFNGYVDIPLHEDFELFLGAGYGFPEFQLMGGLRYLLNDHWEIGAGYKFFKEPWESRPRAPRAIYQQNIFFGNLTYKF